MDVQVNMDKVMEIMKDRLAAANQENILLQAVVQDQQEQIIQLKLTLDKLGEEVQNGNQDEGKQDAGAVGEAR